MSPSLVLIGSFLLLTFCGLPVAFCLGVAAFLTGLMTGIGPAMLVQRISAGIQVFPLIAIPLFILAGGIMAKGGVARRIVDFAYILVGPFRGGLAMVNCIQSMFFGGVSGSAIADISSTGPIMIPMMVEKGYDREFSTAITVASATQGIIIPPSHNMVIYAMIAGGVSVGKLFLAGYIPGIMVGLALMISSYYIAIKRNYPREQRPPLQESLIIIRDGLLAILAAVVIVGGIAFGIFTVSEASAISVFYAIFLGIFVYKEMQFADIWSVLLDAVKTTTSVLFLIGCASAFAWMMTFLQIPSKATTFLLSITDNTFLLYLLINLLLIGLGMIMDVAPLIVIVTPVLLPVMIATGMDPVTFGVVLMLNLGIGLTTPPVGTGLFVGCTVGKTSMERVSVSMLSLWPAMLIVLLLVTYIPQLTMFLPNWLMP
ncbi:TRAP dicarboxylate transporter, DctM subunit [Candidatus Vecturithrix granuli]|uniref:TRAP dicarboxylate transporter, DctM subunit n=1 Tax=Vecturithrix granuli TaxID=1499967 RepID=A0A081C7Q5_VECG1|nr:TRAP dicarboxylate transporter, DctM subunit [Candidatus Vecturithrix granuli]